jgi:hypothetical protein
MSRRRILNFTAAFLLAATPVLAAGFEAELDPVPFDATNRADVIGSIGNVTATLDGSTLTINGTFSAMTSAATGGSVRVGLAKGVPGESIGTLAVSHTPQGTVSGSVTLNVAQVAALQKQSLYIRIDSEKAPNGNLQGWLEATGKN